MSSTRLTSAAVFLAVSGGLVLLANGGSWPLVVLGGILSAGGAILLARHLWRESDRKRKQEQAALQRTLSAKIAGLSDLVATARAETGSDVGEVVKRVDVFTQGVLEYMAQLELEVEDLKQQAPRHAKAIKSLDEVIEGRLDVLTRTSEKERAKILSQVSGVIGVYSTLQPSIPYPAFGGWAIGGDCAQRLVSLIFSLEPRWVVEAGSGLSTILAAQCLDRLGGDRQVISLEHEEKWLSKSRADVAKHDLSHRSQIHLAPLVDVEIGEEKFRWYDLSDVQLPDDIGLIFVDGPPKATGPLARYPAVPLLHDHLATGGVILMDDAARPEERSAIDRWKEEYPHLEFQFHSDSKGTLQITKVHP